MVSSGAAVDPGEDIAVAGLDTPVGRITVAVSHVGLCAVTWGGGSGGTARDGRQVVLDRPRTSPVLAQLEAYFGGDLRQFDLPLDLRAVGRSPRMVLQALYDTVSYGCSVTYGELAHRSLTGVPARGIGSIMGANPIPVVVPCHRVLAQNGLGGYSGGRSGEGLQTKRWLLTLEGVLQPTLDWPGSL